MAEDSSGGWASEIYLAPALDAKEREGIERALAGRFDTGEDAQAMYGITRLRRSVNVLIVTDRRLLTLGEARSGFPIVDSVIGIRGFHLETAKMFSWGRLEVTTVDGVVGLGTLRSPVGEDFVALERQLQELCRAQVSLEVTAGENESLDIERSVQPSGFTPRAPYGVGSDFFLDQARDLEGLLTSGVLTEADFVSAIRKLIG